MDSCQGVYARPCICQLSCLGFATRRGRARVWLRWASHHGGASRFHLWNRERSSQLSFLFQDWSVPPWRPLLPSSQSANSKSDAVARQHVPIARRWISRRRGSAWKHPTVGSPQIAGALWGRLFSCYVFFTVSNKLLACLSVFLLERMGYLGFPVCREAHVTC